MNSNCRQWRRYACHALLLLMILYTFLLCGCGILPQEEELRAAPMLRSEEIDNYVLTQVIRSDIQVSSSIRATYIPSEEERLSFPVGGEPIGRVYVSLGDHVMPGDLLMELNIDSYNEAIRLQQNELDNIGLSLSQLSASWNIDLEEANLEDAWNAAQGTPSNRAGTVNSRYSNQQVLLNSEYQVAQLRMEELERQKAMRQIFASIEGTISSLDVFEAGEAVVKDKNVVTVTNMEQALFEVYSGNTDLIEAGSTYEIVCNDKSYTVTACRPQDLEQNNVKENSMYFRMDEADPDLKQGDIGVVRIVLEESKNTLCVPSEAVQEIAGETIVYVLDEQGFRQIQPVTVGIVGDKLTEIKEGLSEGQSVILK
ncbi:MAG: hypothetical protein J6P72_03185 [Firmicutes bacterium]|nr:hypothetical protein [Bacillota bacterium]